VEENSSGLLPVTAKKFHWENKKKVENYEAFVQRFKFEPVTF
jgi:hypothetical protein